MKTDISSEHSFHPSVCAYCSLSNIKKKKKIQEPIVIFSISRSLQNKPFFFSFKLTLEALIPSLLSFFLAILPAMLLNIYVQLCMHCHTDLTIFCKWKKLSICIFGIFILTSDRCLSTSNTYVLLRVRPLLFVTTTNLGISVCSIFSNCLWFVLIHGKNP